MTEMADANVDVGDDFEVFAYQKSQYQIIQLHNESVMCNPYIWCLIIGNSLCVRIEMVRSVCVRV